MYGHPEEPLGAALCIGAVLVAATSRSELAGALLGLAVINKPGGATYCATKHAVVGLSEAIRAELRDTNIDISVVMPVVVNTELGSGLPQTRGFKPVEPQDVADCIVEALQTGRFDVYVPKSISGGRTRQDVRRRTQLHRERQRVVRP